MGNYNKKGKKKLNKNKGKKIKEKLILEKENVEEAVSKETKEKSQKPAVVVQKPVSLFVKAKIMAKTIFNLQMLSNLIFNPYYLCYGACLFLIGEAILNSFIIENIKYTEIDWKAYMQEVEGFINGTYDYEKLKGDTGPLVYPAGFVYIFAGLYYLTNKGTDIHLAQYIFAGIYLITIALVFRIYHQSKKLPPYILVFVCCISYRVHSIFVLRLFNDTVAMMVFYGAVNLFIGGWWTLGSFVYSLAVSVKMNILLYAPALLMAYLYCLGWTQTFVQLFICAATQVILATPFLLTNPWGYAFRAFDLSRVFLYEWTVNWRCIPEEIFVNKYFHVGLLILHVLVLALFATTHWHRFFIHFQHLQKSKLDASCQLFLLPLFMSNFIGMAFSRSLHYQFYIWYFHSLPYLLWCTRLNVSTRLLLLGVIELCWNTFPSTNWSSILLHGCHLVILGALLYNRPSAERIKSIRNKLLKKE